MLSDLKNRMGTLAVASVAIVGLSMAPFGGTAGTGRTLQERPFNMMPPKVGVHRQKTNNFQK